MDGFSWIWKRVFYGQKLYLKATATKGIFGKLGLTAGGGSMIPTALGGITLASAAAGLSADEDKNKFDIDSYYASGKLNHKAQEWWAVILIFMEGKQQLMAVE